jgi:hypothetical protein
MLEVVGKEMISEIVLFKGLKQLIAWKVILLNFLQIINTSAMDAEKLVRW